MVPVQVVHASTVNDVFRVYDCKWDQSVICSSVRVFLSIPIDRYHRSLWLAFLHDSIIYRVLVNPGLCDCLFVGECRNTVRICGVERTSSFQQLLDPDGADFDQLHGLIRIGTFCMQSLQCCSLCTEFGTVGQVLWHWSVFHCEESHLIFICSLWDDSTRVLLHALDTRPEYPMIFCKATAGWLNPPGNSSLHASIPSATQSSVCCAFECTVIFGMLILWLGYPLPSADHESVELSSSIGVSQYLPSVWERVCRWHLTEYHSVVPHTSDVIVGSSTELMVVMPQCFLQG